MEEQWWQMPGPTRFVQAVAHDLAQGTSVVLALPDHAPAGLLAAVRAHGLGVRWEELCPATDPHLLPLEQFVQHWQLDSDADAPPVQGVDALLRHPDFQPGQRVLIVPAPAAGGAPWAAVWPAWAAFLREYGRVAQSLAPLQRRPLCLLLTGVAAAAAPRPDTGLHVHRYDNQTTELDMLLFAEAVSRTYYPDRPPLRQALYAHTALHLFPADPAATLRLLTLELADLLAPAPLLDEIAQVRRWQPAPSPLPALAQHWPLGWGSTLGGRLYPHLCAPPPGPEPGAVRLHRALWLAQAQVLLPQVERLRHALLRLPFLRTHLQSLLPYEYFLGEKKFVYQEVDDFEMAQLVQAFPPDRRHLSATELPIARRRAEALLQYRNRLSHLHPLPLPEVERLLEMCETTP